MKVFIVETLLGVLAIDENGKLIDSTLFPKDPSRVIECIENIQKYREELIKKMKEKGFSQVEESPTFGKGYFREIAKSLGYTDESLNKFLVKIGIEYSKRRIRMTVKKDKIIIQLIDGIDEIDKSINIFVARLREWYGLHFPEMESSIDKHERFVKLVAEFGLRENIKEENLSQFAKRSMGIELSEEDGKILQKYATSIRDLYKLREHMEKYVEKVMKEISPNFSELATPMIGARLVALAGGIEKLAKKPSSTIQLLGSEKALFRYLRGKGKSPKFGVLFTHPTVQKTPASKRGKVARVLASKMSIAIKMDYYGSEDKSKEMKEDLESRIKEILEDKNVKKE